MRVFGRRWSRWAGLAMLAAGVMSASLSGERAALAERVQPRAQEAASVGGDATQASVAPRDRLEEGWWAARHEAVLAAVKADPDAELVLVGDSITQNYEKAKRPDENFQPTWREFYAPRKALNLGFSGDTTANVLWRLEHGEVDGLKPKVAMVLLGTNNTGKEGQTAEQTEAGLDAVVEELGKRLPGTKVLLLGILPSNTSAAKTKADEAVNLYLAGKYGGEGSGGIANGGKEDGGKENGAAENGGGRVTYLDVGAVFLKSGGLNSNLFYDPRLPEHGSPLHPDTQGQRMMAQAIEPTLAGMLGEAPSEPLRAMTDANTAVIPVPRLEQDSYDWYARHAAELEAQKGMNPKLVLIGDSITHFWGGEPVDARQNGPEAWEKAFHGMKVLNMGFGWDRTQNVLWRLRQGEFVGVKPKWVVINIGTNNLVGTEHARASTPEEVVSGVAAIVRVVRERAPDSRVVVMAIFPRGERPTDSLRAPIARTNGLLKEEFQATEGVTVLDIGKEFLLPDGTLPKEMMPDGTHPSEAGYTVWAKGLAKIGVKR